VNKNTDHKSDRKDSNGKIKDINKTQNTENATQLKGHKKACRLSQPGRYFVP